MKLPRPLFIGTCRVLWPADLLRANKLPVRRVVDRVHTPHEIESLVRFLRGEPVFDRSSIHLLSDRAFATAVATPDGADVVLQSLEHLRSAWDRFDSFVIEISSLREFHVLRDGERFYLNTLSSRDLREHAARIDALIEAGAVVPVRHQDVVQEMIGTGVAVAAMKRIKALVGERPIVWCCHANVIDPSEKYRHVHATREHVAKVVALGAFDMKDVFYDPTEIVRKLGQAAAFDKGGEDLFHFTEEAKAYLAERYWGLVNQSLVPQLLQAAS